jgi:drug/metabolite transporter (DMT)-like permease
MDAPWSLPRLYVATLFAAAALAAVAGAARNPGRRTWWLAVGAVAAGVAVVKAGSTVHVTVMDRLTAATSAAGAVAISATGALLVLAVLAVISRAERRDRRRVLTALGLYAVASVGLSALPGLVGGQWAAMATFVEESGEALAGVAVLVAVLVGVAPRLVLPAAWLRRRDDALSLEAPAVRLPAAQD